MKRDKFGHGLEADYWSIGVILYNMLYGSCPFISDNVDEVYKKIREGDYILDNNIDKKANELIEKLLI